MTDADYILEVSRMWDLSDGQKIGIICNQSRLHSYSTRNTKFQHLFIYPKQKSIYQHRGVYFWKFNPPLFATLSLPQTEIRPKHNQRVNWAQNKCYFWIQHPWKPLYRHFVQLYLWFFSFFLYFGVICLISPNWGDNSRLIACRGW